MVAKNNFVVNRWRRDTGKEEVLYSLVVVVIYLARRSLLEIKRVKQEVNCTDYRNGITVFTVTRKNPQKSIKHKKYNKTRKGSH